MGVKIQFEFWYVLRIPDRPLIVGNGNTMQMVQESSVNAASVWLLPRHPTYDLWVITRPVFLLPL